MVPLELSDVVTVLCVTVMVIHFDCSDGNCLFLLLMSRLMLKPMPFLRCIDFRICVLFVMVNWSGRLVVRKSASSIIMTQSGQSGNCNYMEIV